MSTDVLAEARRHIEICNACRYCEGYCAVFPAITRQRSFAEGDVIQLASLCHNCRACYYACQYTAPHEFALNVPRILAEMRHDAWKQYAWPHAFAHLYDKSGVAISLLLVIGTALLFVLAQLLRPEAGEGFYAYMSHSVMIAIFGPAFLGPMAAIAIAVARYWRTVDGGRPRREDLWAAFASAGRLRNLAGGHGDGCNFEAEDRFTHARRWLHQATMYGFLLCFASTVSGTILHYGFDRIAPHGAFSAPKLLGVPGGVLLCLGTAGLAWLKTKADRNLGAPHLWGGEMAFVLLLFSVSATGLLLYAATGSSAVGWLLPLHLGTVLTFFLLTPYSKMTHGFLRLAALVADAAKARRL